MQLSKLCQGLALSAVSALVITGLTVSAPAALAADGPGVRLLSQHDGLASVRADADFIFARTMSLTAEVLDPNATVTFEYNPDPTAGDDATGWTAVPGTPAAQQGYVRAEWSPDGTLVGTTFALRAVATTPAAGDIPATTTYSTRHGVALSGQDSPVHAVTLGPTSMATTEVGPLFFEQPYADSSRTARLLRVAGGTSATEGTVELSAWNAEAGAFQGHTDAAVSATEFKTFDGHAPGSVDGGTFSGVIDIAGFDAEDGDVVAVRAERDSDSVVPVLLQAQTITSITATLAEVAGPENTPVTLRVSDQDDRPVLGAEVRSADGTRVGYTDTRGQVVAAQPNSTATTYYANTTDTDAFEHGVDVATGAIESPAYVAVLEGIEAVLADGSVFDDREHAEGDIALQLVDGRGEPFATEDEVTYTLHRTGEASPAPTTVRTDANGHVVVPFDPAGPDGEYTLTFTEPDSLGGDEEEPVTFIAGDAVLGLTPAAGTAPSGGEITYAGTVTVEGEPLAGRDIDLAYAPGAEQAPGTDADASLVVKGERALGGRIAVGDDGTFSVTVDDPEEAGSPAETGGTLTVTVRGLGDTMAATADFTAVATDPVPTPVPTPTPGTDPGDGPAALRLTGWKAGPLVDRLRVGGPSWIGGAEIRVYAKADGRWQRLKARKLNRQGDAKLRLRDHNGNRFTRYYVRLLPSADVPGTRSSVRRIK